MSCMPPAAVHKNAWVTFAPMEEPITNTIQADLAGLAGNVAGQGSDVLHAILDSPHEGVFLARVGGSNTDDRA